MTVTETSESLWNPLASVYQITKEVYVSISLERV